MTVTRLRFGRRSSTPEAVFRCGSAARWMPRVLAASILAAALLVSYRFAPSFFDEAIAPYVKPLRGFLVVVGAVAALWVLRAGAESRVVIRLDDEGVGFSWGRRRAELRYEQIERLEFEFPLARARSLLPATALRDRQGQIWRLPAALDDGRRLIVELLSRAGRSDLTAWAESYRLAERMSHGPTVVAAGYGLSLVILVAAWSFYRARIG